MENFDATRFFGDLTDSLEDFRACRDRRFEDDFYDSFEELDRDALADVIFEDLCRTFRREWQEHGDSVPSSQLMNDGYSDWAWDTAEQCVFRHDYESYAEVLADLADEARSEFANAHEEEEL